MSLELDGAIPPEQNTALYGHEDCEAFLASAYQSGKIHHALLLEGEAGIGKATLAFRFANHVLSYPDMQNAPQTLSAPDETSPVFRQISGGASHNLLHVQCAVDPKTGKVKSGISVDDIRRAGRFLSQTSGSDNWRVVVIDTADQLNRSAANAILKILEEPPRRTIFIVLSHSPGRLLPTIRSRCLSLRLRPLSNDDLLKALEHLGALSNIDQDAIAGLLSLSEGSVLRALTILNYGGTELVELFHDLIETHTVPDRKQIHKLAESLAHKDQDVNFKFFCEYMVDFIRKKASSHARNGALDAAHIWAELSLAFEHHILEAETYNMDRKQTLLTLFSMLFDTQKRSYS